MPIDHGKKFMLYRQLPFLEEYIMLFAADLAVEKLIRNRIPDPENTGSRRIFLQSAPSTLKQRNGEFTGMLFWNQRLSHQYAT
jgi:hypothetical protein